MSGLHPSQFFDLSAFAHRTLFDGVESVWNVLERLHPYLETLMDGASEGEISPQAYLIHPEHVVIGPGTVVEAGAYIQGPCVIGANSRVRHGAYIRGGVLAGDRVMIGHDTEVKNSILFDDAKAAHFAYIGDSILGNQVNLGAGTSLANLRLDGKEVVIRHGNTRIATGLRKLGRDHWRCRQPRMQLCCQSRNACGPRRGYVPVHQCWRSHPNTSSSKALTVAVETKKEPSMPSMLTATSIAALGLIERLQAYHDRFDADIARYSEVLGDSGRLREATEYALTGPGKRIRPALVYMMADSLGHALDVGAAAVAIECAHCASLIADDLPCMDDDQVRRGRPTCHRAFDEATALLASYTLISSGFHLLILNAEEMRKGPAPFAQQSGRAAQVAVKCVAEQTGGWGLTLGQYKDLYHPPSDIGSLMEVYQQKTGCLFQASLVLGWVFGGGEPENIELVHQFGMYLGNLFQLVNDCKDADPNSGRSSTFNGMKITGKKGMADIAECLAADALSALGELGMESAEMEALVTSLHTAALEYLKQA